METKELTSKQIIRNFNLYILSDIPLEEPYLSIYNDLESIFSDMNIYESDDEYWSKYIYYGHSKDDLYIRYDEKNGKIWLDTDNIWSVFESKYDLSYQTIQGITQWSIGNTLHLKGTTNERVTFLSWPQIGNTLHLKGTTNSEIFILWNLRIGNTLHLKGTTNQDIF